jgi:hypothetical protein
VIEIEIELEDGSAASCAFNGSEVLWIRTSPSTFRGWDVERQLRLVGRSESSRRGSVNVGISRDRGGTFEVERVRGRGLVGVGADMLQGDNEGERGEAGRLTDRNDMTSASPLVGFSGAVLGLDARGDDDCEVGGVVGEIENEVIILLSLEELRRLLTEEKSGNGADSGFIDAL